MAATSLEHVDARLPDTDIPGHSLHSGAPRALAYSPGRQGRHDAFDLVFRDRIWGLGLRVEG